MTKSPAKGGAAAAGSAGPTLEEDLGRLEEIAREIEGGALSLEDSLARYREARRLYTRCLDRLTAAEREVETLLAMGDAAPGGQADD